MARNWLKTAGPVLVRASFNNFAVLAYAVKNVPREKVTETLCVREAPDANRH